MNTLDMDLMVDLELLGHGFCFAKNANSMDF